jgi:uncharacterized protein (DUF1501 family)
MDRRKFLRDSMLLGGVPVIIGNLPIRAFANLNSPLTNTDCLAIRNRVMVIIQMEGGNDGLNTIIPKAQYSIYKTKRPTIAIPETGANAFINLDNTLPVNNQVGLHPAMTAFKDLYDAGKLNVMHGVGYADNNRSHFKGTDLWLTAGDVTTPGLFDLTSGWMGRYLDYSYPGLINNPTPQMPDPLALELGASTGSLGFKTNGGQYANILLTTDAGNFSTAVAGLGGPPVNPFPTSQMGIRLAHVRNIEQSINAYSTRVTNTYNAGNNMATYPANSWLSYQLKTVARLIKGGSKTRVFMVHTGGYDTHNGQVVSGNPTTGHHANILKDLADSIKAFQTDLNLLGLEDKVITATFSEFGRTLGENASMGTDHGGVSNLFIVGKGVRPGVSGNPVNLTNVVDDGVMDLQFDYRRIYTALLQDFMGAGNGALSATYLSNFQNNKPNIISEATKADPACYADILVPVKLTDFTAVLESDGSVTVKWTTQQELNTSHFMVERSGTIGGYEELGRVNGFGNSSIPRNYQFNDRTPLRGTNLYRLKQVDKNGDFTYYGPVPIRVNNNVAATVAIAPNPAIGFFNIQTNANKSGRATVQIFDLQGHLLTKQEFTMSNGTNNWRINIDRFAKGNVVVLIQTSTGIKHSQQIAIK